MRVGLQPIKILNGSEGSRALGFLIGRGHLYNSDFTAQNS